MQNNARKLRDREERQKQRVQEKTQYRGN